MKKTILILIVVFLALALVSSVEALVVKQSVSNDLKIPCFNDDNLCSGSATCNLTVFYPDNSLLLDNQAMTNSVAYFNYSLNATQISTLGNHRSAMVCWDGTDTGSLVFTLLVTPNGEEDENDILKLVMVIAILIVLILYLPLLLMAIENTIFLKMTMIRTSLYIGFYIFMLYIYIMSKRYIFESQITDLLTPLVEVGGVIFVIIVIVGYFLNLVVGTILKHQGGKHG